MWFKKKPWIRFYSLDENVAELYPVEPVGNIERHWNNSASVKRNRPEQGKQIVLNCPAIKTITNFGYVLRAPMDFVIKTNSTTGELSWETPVLFKRQSSKYTFGGTDYYVSYHSPAQTDPLIPAPGENLNRNFLNSAIKIETPWRVKASDDIVLLQVPVSYNNENRFVAAQGIVDPKYMHAVSVQLFWNVLDGETLIKAGTPLVQYIPVNREFLNKKSIDLIVNAADDVDTQIEDAYTFANHSRFPKFDTMANKVKIITALFDHYRKKFPKNKI